MDDEKVLNEEVCKFCGAKIYAIFSEHGLGGTITSWTDHEAGVFIIRWTRTIDLPFPGLLKNLESERKISIFEIEKAKFDFLEGFVTTWAKAIKEALERINEQK